jgi:hypothetical protein
MVESEPTAFLCFALGLGYKCHFALGLAQKCHNQCALWTLRPYFGRHSCNLLYGKVLSAVHLDASLLFPAFL